MGWDGRLSRRHHTTLELGHAMFQFNFFGYLYLSLSLWNHLFGRVALYEHPDGLLPGRTWWAHHRQQLDVTPGGRILTEQHDVDSPDYPTVKKPVVVQDNRGHRRVGHNPARGNGGEGAVIATGAVVVKDVDPYTLEAGNPAVKKRDRARDVRYRLDYRRPFHRETTARLSV